MNSEQLAKIAEGMGFVAALDQSGGSTPKALKLYGIDESAYSSEEEMFDLVHEMRTRIVTNPAFDGDRVIGVILFEATMDREFEGMPAADYLWQRKKVVPFLKVDKGLAELADDVQLMKPMPQLGELLERAKQKNIFGTKMRSVVVEANPKGIEAILDQQFEVGQQIADAGLLPILEPEVSIKATHKPRAEVLLKRGILERLDALPANTKVALKLTLPTIYGYYEELIKHPKVVRVLALSGGYPRIEAVNLLMHNPGMIGSFSRALTEGLSVEETDEEFTVNLDAAIDIIHHSSTYVW